MRFTRAAHAARTWDAGTTGRGHCRPGGCSGEGGKLLGQFRRTAMRAFRTLPVAGPHQDLAVLLTFPAMKLVNRHGQNLINRRQRLNWLLRTPPKAVPAKTELRSVTMRLRHQLSIPRTDRLLAVFAARQMHHQCFKICLLLRILDRRVCCCSKKSFHFSTITVSYLPFAKPTI